MSESVGGVGVVTERTFGTLKVRLEDEVAWLELNHGKANEMGKAEIGAFEGLCGWLEAGNARVLVTSSRRVSSKGTPIFISGANVTERSTWDTTAIKRHVRWQRAILARLRRAPVFHVAVVDGIALGWGTEFMLACDWRIAGPSARFGLPETSLGIVPGAGGASELAMLVGLPQALRLGMTGEQVGAEEAQRIGLVDEVVASVDAGLARAAALAAMVRRRSPTAVATFKAAALAAGGRSEDERRRLEAEAYEHCVDTGEAAIGRAHFAEIVAGGPPPPWSAFKAWRP
ncbi:MAG: enoyl-CoA hydratase/isomerase family protein [Myxococcota bacterium]